MGTELPEEAAQAVAAGIPMGRRATAEDVANAVLFLASAEASFLTGVCLDIDGGRTSSSSPIVNIPNKKRRNKCRTCQPRMLFVSQ
jgi:enoyl-[acyl-carrier-protein] reductase (NADH)